MAFLESLRLSGLLSFTPDSPAIPLQALNVLIGPNGCGKSNFIEGVELLRATPSGLASVIRDGGGARDWIWKGEESGGNAAIEALLAGQTPIPPLRYRLSFEASGHRTEVTDEAIEEQEPRSKGRSDVFFYYRFQEGNPAINVREVTDGADGNKRIERRLKRQSLPPDESVLSQRKDPDLYPELTWVGQQFARIQTFREWSFGRYPPLRQSQPADLPASPLLPDSRNLGLLLNQIEHRDEGAEFNRLLSRFLPRFKRLSTLVQGGTIQFYLHEDGLHLPVPASRLSDGTIRFMAILALLLDPAPPPLICIEEPELGLHPDAVGLLADLLFEASSRTQLIVTTHSDALISALTEHVESVLVCEWLSGTRMQRLESKKLSYWLERYRLGEVWRLGELGGNP